MTDRTDHNRAVALMVIVTLMWSIAGVVSRQLQSAASLEVTFWRSLFTLLFVAAVLVWQHRVSDLKIKLHNKSLWASGVCWSVMFTAFMIAITLTTVANVLITMSLAPLFTLILARLWLRKSINTSAYIAILIAVCGMLWMFSGDVAITSGAHSAGILTALCVPIAAAINWNLSERSGDNIVRSGDNNKKSSDAIDLIPAVMIGALISTLFTLPFALPFKATGADIAWLALLGVVQPGFPCMLAVWCAQRLPAPELSLLCLLEVIFGVLWAWLGAGEQPSQRVIVGGTLVLAALAFNEWYAMQQVKQGIKT
jgi:drug/metabolite transporter (DMT)-like permease